MRPAAADAAECRARLNPQIRSIAAAAAHARGLLNHDPKVLADAVALYADGPRPLASAAALEDLGAATVDGGNTDDAVEAFGRALELYAGAGAAWDAGRVRGRLRALGVRRRLVAAQRPGTGWAAMTDSELAVARLVAQGLTNREVAERLFVSQHTVSGHLRHVFAKLDVNSRVELTRLAGLHDLGREPLVGADYPPVARHVRARDMTRTCGAHRRGEADTVEVDAQRASMFVAKGGLMGMDLAIRNADGVKIRFAEAGQGASETAVLTSPWPESLLAFRKVWDRLAEQFHLVAIDLPGFGQSERQFDLLSPPAMGAFLLQLVTEWDLGPVHLVAQDVGTSAALWAAASNPSLLRSLVVGGGGIAVPLQVGGSLKDIIEAPDMEGFRQIDSKEILGPTYDAMAGGPPPPDVRDDYLESYAGDRFVESARYVRTYPAELPNLAEKLPGIETPVQIVCGRDDPLVPMANQEFLHERLPNSRMDLLPAGHFAWEEVPDLYGDVLMRWLSAGYREPHRESMGPATAVAPIASLARRTVR